MPVPRMLRAIGRANAAPSPGGAPDPNEWQVATINLVTGELDSTYEVSLASGGGATAKSCIDAPLAVGDSVYVVMEAGISAIIVGQL